MRCGGDECRNQRDESCYVCAALKKNLKQWCLQGVFFMKEIWLSGRGVFAVWFLEGRRFNPHVKICILTLQSPHYSVHSTCRSGFLVNLRLRLESKSQQSSTRRQPFPAALRCSIFICNDFPTCVCPSTTWPVLNDTSICWLISPQGQNINHSNISFHFIFFLFASYDIGGESFPG